LCIYIISQPSIVKLLGIDDTKPYYVNDAMTLTQCRETADPWPVI